MASRGKNKLNKIKSTMHDSQKAAISSYMGLAVYEIQRNSTSYDLMNKVILSTVHNFTHQLKAKILPAFSYLVISMSNT